MPPITDDLRPTILLLTGIFFILTLITAFLIRKNIDYWIRRMIPQLHEKPPTNQSAKSILLGGFFWIFLASTLVGAILSRPVNDAALVDQFDNSFTLPTPDNTLSDSGVPPLRLEVDFPPALDPCAVDAFTLIPEEVDPYDLPPIYPIDEWFERHQFVNRAFARISITNTATGQELQLANRIIARIIQRQEITGTYNAAYTICNVLPITDLPQIDLIPGDLVAETQLGQEQFLKLEPWDREVIEIELAALEPGIYEVEVGVEYTDGEELVRVWSPQTLHLYTPESFHRWSAGVVTYWGLCSFEGGEYICEELEYEEPVLVVEETSREAEEETEEGSEEESTDPTTCRPAPPSRLSVGMDATVSFRLSLRLRIREAPGLDSRVITAMNRGTEMTIIDGPVCQDGYLWWEIERNDGITGWSAEGEPWMYYLEP
jgi:hypothetical protein